MTVIKRGRGAPPGPRVSAELLDAVYAGVLANLTGPAIYRSLDKPLQDEASQRTVERLVMQLRPKPEDEPWSLDLAAPDEAQQVPPLMRHFIDPNSDVWQGLTKRQARTITNVRLATQTLDPRWQWEIALKYLARRAANLPTETLDELVTWSPWEKGGVQWPFYFAWFEIRHPDMLPDFDSDPVRVEGALLTALKMWCEVTSKEKGHPYDLPLALHLWYGPKGKAVDLLTEEGITEDDGTTS